MTRNLRIFTRSGWQISATLYTKSRLKILDICQFQAKNILSDGVDEKYGQYQNRLSYFFSLDILKKVSFIAQRF